MAYRFVPMTEEYAREIIHNWRYPEPYDCYNYDKDAEVMLDRSRWGKSLFAVLDDGGELVGEFGYEFYDDDVNYLPEHQENAVLWIGFGLRPSHTGKGMGYGFILAGLEFILRHTGYQGKYVQLAVASFNTRARKVYARTGFEEFGLNPENPGIAWMRKEL